MKNWRKYLWGTLSTVTVGTLVYIGAIFHSQPDKPVVNAPVIQMVSDRECKLAQTYSVTVSNWTITVREGFVYDGASIPDYLIAPLGLNPFSGVLARGALIHDGLYASHLLPQEIADDLLLMLILQDGCEKHKADAVWQGVHEWGFKAYQGHQGPAVVAARKFVAISCEARN